MASENTSQQASSLVLFQTEDGRTRIECRFQDESVWLTQPLMAELFQVTPQNISTHLKAIYSSGELVEEATSKDYLLVRSEGGRVVTRLVKHYNLPVIIAIGYRVKSHRGTQFRQWATAHLNEYLVKGFTMDDERLKNPSGPGYKDYFDELLERIRDIRSSERRFYQKVLDIYATSVDYSPDTEASQKFFATVQNKMHFAVHGRTAAEIIHERADSTKPHMGLMTTRPDGTIRKGDVAIAKNYLTEPELGVLNRIVNMYIEFAELQALERRPMTMNGWIAKLDEFLKISGRDVLENAGSKSAETARLKAEAEYEKYHRIMDSQPRPVDADYERVLKQIEGAPGRGKRPRKLLVKE
ncbi:MAG TPA: virulence RhuM family protein [Myxococcota bacterium]|nr:virulence RhuM family protein [Myxococcota bacterium]HPV05162.1 virulence RhuM family protein [Myxococcota bacterium]